LRCICFSSAVEKEQGLSQEEFAQKIGTTKQVLSRYETNLRSPKISTIAAYAEKLDLSLDYMLGDSAEELSFYELCPEPKKEKEPFYKIFIDVTAEMGLDIPGIMRVTGLTKPQVQTIIFKRMKDAPLPLALLLSDKLGVSLKIWTGDEDFESAEISVEAREVALAYDKADKKSKSVVRTALDLEIIKIEKK
jgi:transcriptional regulator with XRE-family HTH domain